jgi:hypothetical protein
MQARGGLHRLALTERKRQQQRQETIFAWNEPLVAATAA